ncbi:hypothetical protein [Desulfomonile tiedjei]|nr:hypothetical protein [Desulfomonile tiedjei]
MVTHPAHNGPELGEIEPFFRKCGPVGHCMVALSHKEPAATPRQGVTGD